MRNRLVIEDKRNRYIYALYDPRTNSPRYVGQTSMPKHRMNVHTSDKKHGVAKREWFAELDTVGLKPVMVILEQVWHSEVDERERYWAQKFISEGHQLTNAANTYPMLNLDERTLPSGLAWNTRRQRMLEQFMALMDERGIEKPLSPQGNVSKSAVVEYALKLAIEALSDTPAAE